MRVMVVTGAETLEGTPFVAPNEGKGNNSAPGGRVNDVLFAMGL
jgi:hypothetical protein